MKAEIIVIDNEVIMSTPIEPIKHGRWINTDEMIGYRCSVCGKGGDRKANYCPNCGADMREVELTTSAEMHPEKYLKLMETDEVEE